jgi:hypothetical protein
MQKYNKKQEDCWNKFCDSSDQDWKDCWKKSALKYHPDKNPGKKEDELFNELFKELNNCNDLFAMPPPPPPQPPSPSFQPSVSFTFGDQFPDVDTLSGSDYTDVEDTPLQSRAKSPSVNIGRRRGRRNRSTSRSSLFSADNDFGKMSSRLARSRSRSRKAATLGTGRPRAFARGSSLCRSWTSTFK